MGAYGRCPCRGLTRDKSKACTEIEKKWRDVPEKLRGTSETPAKLAHVTTIITAWAHHRLFAVAKQTPLEFCLSARSHSDCTPPFLPPPHSSPIPHSGGPEPRPRQHGPVGRNKQGLAAWSFVSFWRGLLPDKQTRWCRPSLQGTPGMAQATQALGAYSAPSIRVAAQYGAEGEGGCTVALREAQLRASLGPMPDPLADDCQELGVRHCENAKEVSPCGCAAAPRRRSPSRQHRPTRSPRPTWPSCPRDTASRRARRPCPASPSSPTQTAVAASHAPTLRPLSRTANADAARNVRAAPRPPYVLHDACSRCRSRLFLSYFTSRRTLFLHLSWLYRGTRRRVVRWRRLSTPCVLFPS